MNGGQIKIIIDTNILFMAIYNADSKANKIIDLANEGKISLFSTDTVKTEISRILKRELGFVDEKIKKYIEGLPIIWINKEVYETFLEKTKVKHKEDKPIEALSLVLNCGILSADKHFKNIKNKINVNKLLKKLEK